MIAVGRPEPPPPAVRAAVPRRTVLRGALALGAIAAVPAGRATASPAGRQVAVLGGGVAGLTAAHELNERGFQVTVFERRAFGGRARSIAVPGTGSGGRADLPGEHGFRFFPGFYHHLPDTMRRIPFPGNANGVHDNLVPGVSVRLSRIDGDDLRMPLGRAGGLSFDSPDAVRETLGGAIELGLRIPPAEAAYFASRLLVYFTSCDERRLGQWERQSWRDFVGASGRSAEYSRVFSRALTSALVAAKESVASTRTIGSMGEQFLGNPAEQGNDGPLDRVLNGPTNEAWIDPWVELLRERGVRFVLPATVQALETDGRRIAAARFADGSRFDADHFVVALPVQDAYPLWSPEILALDPALAGMRRLHTDWMNGIQYYLRTRLDDLVRGHVAMIDSPWALTAVAQQQFWRRTVFPQSFGDGSSVRDCLSVDISDWNTPGLVNRKPAIECTAQEVSDEVWAQLTAHLNDRTELLRRDDLHSWFLDPGITWDPATGRNRNADPLLVNTAGSWADRPEAHGAIENLFLAGDYVRTGIDLATMEGANESARSAVNALLDVAGSNAPKCAKFQLYRAPELEPLRQQDRARYAAGQPNLLDLSS